MKTIIALVLATILVLYAPFYLNKKECEGQWENSGMKFSWGAIKGCMIQRQDGTWIPADAYREVAK